jgi:hypothetical protein
MNDMHFDRHDQPVKLDATPTRIRVVRSCHVLGRRRDPGEILELPRLAAEVAVLGSRCRFAGPGS